MSLARHRLVLVVSAVAVLVLGGIGYAAFIPHTAVQHSRLSHLVVATPPPGFTAKPASATVMGGSSSPYTIVQTDSKRFPRLTGAYTVAWTSSVSQTDAATLTVSLLPSASDAQKAQAQALTEFLGPNSMQSSQYKYGGAFKLSGPAGAKGAVFSSSSNKGAFEVVAAYPVDRVQILQYVGMTAPLATIERTAQSLADSEHALLQQELPGFKLEATTLPVVASVLYIALVVVIALAIVGVPEAVALTRTRRARAREEALRREMRVRGSKVVKRQAHRAR